MLAEHGFQALAQPREFQICEDLLGEGAGQHLLRPAGPDAAAAQVEERFGIQPADRRAVRAAYVVGVDLELGTRIDLGVLTQEKVGVALLGNGLLGILLN